MTFQLDTSGAKATSPAILGCPFCGSDASPVERPNPLSKWKWSVDCNSTSCGASGPVETTYTAAVWAWNSRASTAPPSLSDDGLVYLNPGEQQ